MSAALELLYGLVLEDGRRWGDAATEWQRADAEAILDVDADRRYQFLTRPRGASKTADLGGVAIACLLEQLPARSRAYALAADRGQASLLIDSIAGFVERTPGLGGALQVDSFRVTVRSSGSSIEALAADEASAWGLRPHLLIVDELAQWKSTSGPRRLWSATFSALPKVAGSRLVVLTSAGDPAHWSFRLLERAKESTLWRVNEVPGPCPWLSPADLAEQEATLPEWEYRRLHLNEWVAADDRLVSVDDLRACVSLDGPRPAVAGRFYALGVDIGLKNDRTVVTVCSLDEADGSRVVGLDRMGVWQGSRAAPVSLDDVEAWILQAWSEYGRPPVVCDPYQAAQLMQRLRVRGVEVEEYAFTSQSVSRLAVRLHQLIRDRALVLPDDGELLDELANVRLIERSPGVYRMDHDPDKHDDRAIALALAACWLVDTPAVLVDELVFVDPLTGEFTTEEPPTVRISDF